MSQKVKDPVCGMDVEVEGNTLQATYEGNTYYFCSKICVEMFKKEPGKYVTNADECCDEKSEHECCGEHDGHHHAEHGHHHHKGHKC